MSRTGSKNSALRLLSHSLLCTAALGLGFLMAVGEAQAQKKGRQGKSRQRARVAALPPKIYELEKPIVLSGACEGTFGNLPEKLEKHSSTSTDRQDGIEFEGGRFNLYLNKRQWSGRVVSLARSERWINASVNLTFEPRLQDQPIFSLSLWGCQGYASPEACWNPSGNRPTNNKNFMLIPAQNAEGFTFNGEGCEITAPPTIPQRD